MFDGVMFFDYMYLIYIIYGDGSEIDLKVIEYIWVVGWRNVVGFFWCKRDVLVLDNLVV